MTSCIDNMAFMRHIRRVMRIENQMTDDRILLELGERLARVRLEQNLTQNELAREAGVGLRTVQRLETGAVATQLSGFLRVCRALRLAERFEVLIPEPVASPIARLKRAGKQRRRASGRAPAAGGAEKWKWGNEP
jgi:transcriptional regulator with XRE-family HTH domain